MGDKVMTPEEVDTQKEELKKVILKKLKKSPDKKFIFNGCHYELKVIKNAYIFMRTYESGGSDSVKQSQEKPDDVMEKLLTALKIVQEKREGALLQNVFREDSMESSGGSDSDISTVSGDSSIESMEEYRKSTELIIPSHDIIHELLEDKNIAKRIGMYRKDEAMIAKAEILIKEPQSDIFTEHLSQKNNSSEREGLQKIDRVSRTRNGRQGFFKPYERSPKKGVIGNEADRKSRICTTEYAPAKVVSSGTANVVSSRQGSPKSIFRAPLEPAEPLLMRQAAVFEIGPDQNRGDSNGPIPRLVRVS